ncbi:hypothetical protein CC86DRAFT_194947 [Ophiobolus disseminans]|uniref:Uncharacterized protein n=1 Tax=Ophiobolus disseminans TaxID=1469910 RepID=A0A6A7A5I6_9PLEO|nr:hypothetical protein CC86DRAFT_194947 [Ophiobolus disseminans]
MKKGSRRRRVSPACGVLYLKVGRSLAARKVPPVAVVGCHTGYLHFLCSPVSRAATSRNASEGFRGGPQRLQRRAPGRCSMIAHRTRIGAAEGVGSNCALLATCRISGQDISGTKSAIAPPSRSFGQKGKGRSEPKSTSHELPTAVVLLLPARGWQRLHVRKEVGR